MMNKIACYLGRSIFLTIPLFVPLSYYKGWPDIITCLFAILYVLDGMFINYLMWYKGDSP